MSESWVVLDTNIGRKTPLLYSRNGEIDRKTVEVEGRNGWHCQKRK